MGIFRLSLHDITIVFLHDSPVTKYFIISTHCFPCMISSWNKRRVRMHREHYTGRTVEKQYDIDKDTLLFYIGQFVSRYSSRSQAKRVNFNWNRYYNFSVKHVRLENLLKSGNYISCVTDKSGLPTSQSTVLPANGTFWGEW